jgi:trehalose 6-phosphate synthase
MKLPPCRPNFGPLPAEELSTGAWVGEREMARLVVVSNRIPYPCGTAKAGGLVTALTGALEGKGGIWFGWTGRTTDVPDRQATVIEANGYALAGIDLSASELAGYYDQLANRALWPAFHGRPDLVRLDHAAYATYRGVNRRFAEALYSLLRADDVVWVHDYHLIPLGHDLRGLGVGSPIGFFLHIPFPPAETFAALPWSRELADNLAAYDLVGFQTPACVQNFREYVNRYVAGAVTGSRWIRTDGRTVRIEAHPIGIDTRCFAELAGSPAVAARVERIRNCLGNRAGIAGVERLDYTKGIAERFHALEALFEQSPQYVNRVSLFQVAAPSRLAVPEYRTLKAELEALSGRINARFGNFDWTPIRYRNQAFTYPHVAALLRACRVGLVTPLRDGMNLVAKEYVAAQQPADPGVLVLSCFAGAAHQLTDAVIVNPHDAEAMAQALRTALEMTLPERLARWKAMMRILETNDVHCWRQDFVDALTATRANGARQAAA